MTQRHQKGSTWLLFILLLALPGMLQAVETTSSIRGKVVDASGTPVAGREVQVTDQRTGVSRNFATNSQGTFLASRLPVGGPYQITVSDKTVTVDSISLGDVYNVYIDLGKTQAIEEVLVYGKSSSLADVAAGPSATFSSYDLETAVAFNRDIKDVYGIDPRINIDGDAVNCGGKHPRFNSISLDGVSQDDRFGLNENGYSTVSGSPFPFGAIEQISVELAPFDVTFGGFSACSINAVTKSGGNEWDGNVFFEYSNQSGRGDDLGDSNDYSTPDFDDQQWGFSVGGPIIQDRLFFFVAYENSERPEFLARGYSGEGNGADRAWLSKADYDRIVSIAGDVYNYNPGGSPGDGSRDDEKYVVRLDWHINDDHNLAFIYNDYDGFEDRSSDGDDNEFEFANHFYAKGTETDTYTVKLASYWTDAFSTEVYYSVNEIIDSQVTQGPKDFGDFQISIGGRTGTVYLGADDSRQANRLSTKTDYFRLSAQLLLGDNVITAGYERDELEIFNQFVQHARGGEYDFFDSSADNPASCAALTAEGRFMDDACGLSGIDRFELGRPSRIYYGSGGGTNNPDDAAANYTTVRDSLFIQDEIYLSEQNLTIVVGLRYDQFSSSDRPKFNKAFEAANNKLRNDANIDGLDLLMPRLGITWAVRDDLDLRGGIGLYSGGNPNVWISNAWSNDGISNVQERLNNFGGDGSVLDDTIPITAGGPGRGVPQTLFDEVATTTAEDASTSRLVLIDPSYEQPSEWKFALGGTWHAPWGITADFDYLHTRANDPAMYFDLSQSVVSSTVQDVPIYAFTPDKGQNNYMLTNSSRNPKSNLFSLVLRKEFDFGVDLMLGYAYTTAEDVVPMTSAVAFSNFNNLATLDINDPAVGDSNYVVPHRLTLRASYGFSLFEELETRVTLYGYANEGQAQSYTMGSEDAFEAGGDNGRHLLYVPARGDAGVVLGENFDTDAFYRFVEREGLGTGFVDRNEVHVRWSNRFDLRIEQELPTYFEGTSGRIFLKLYNLGNLINEDWGHVNDAEFFSVEVVEASVNDDRQLVFEKFNDGDVRAETDEASLWSIRLGIEFNF